MLFVPLVAATYFMVSGGPYGIEDILGGAGFLKAILILLILPVIWCLPTALMVGELASAIPAEGGFYVWVRRALGPFWGYQAGGGRRLSGNVRAFAGAVCGLRGSRLLAWIHSAPRNPMGRAIRRLWRRVRFFNCGFSGHVELHGLG